MNRILLLAFLFLFSLKANATDGYQIKIKFDDYSSGKVFLAHYYGKPLPTIYRVDSSNVDGKGNVLLKTNRKIIGGLYLLILEDNKRYFEFILNNGDELNITANTNSLPSSVVFANSRENSSFIEYTSKLEDIGIKHRKYMSELTAARSRVDSSNLQQKIKNLSISVGEFRNSYIKENSDAFLSTIFNTLTPTAIPSSIKEQNARYSYYKNHYWDNIDFSDDRLVYTPILDNKLAQFFNSVVTAIPDSINKEADVLLKKARSSKEVFKYITHWLTTFSDKSEVMGMDAVFVHIVENYHMKGDAFWLNEGTLSKYIDRARSIAPNVIGNIAPEMKMMGLDRDIYSLHEIDAKYTIVFFWSPDCGHCVEEVPRIDSVYKKLKLKDKGVKILGFNVDNDVDLWKKVIKDKNVSDSWLHVYDPGKISKFRSQYDVYGTPSIYLLDKKKIIKGKKLDHGNLEQLINILEEQEAAGL